MTLVASNLPPKPVSIRVTSARVRENAKKAAAVVISNNVIGSPALTSSHSLSILVSESSLIF